MIDGQSEIDLAGVLRLAVTAFCRPSGEGDALYETLVPGEPGSLWRTAGGHVDALLLDRRDNLGREDESGWERYCLVYRRATIGSGRECTWQVQDKGLEPVQAAFVYLWDRFYLDNLSDRTDLLVNARALQKNELMPFDLRRSPAHWSPGDGVCPVFSSVH